MAEVQDESKIEKQQDDEEQQQQQQTTVTGEVIQTEIVKLTVVNKSEIFRHRRMLSFFVGK